jgi:hypothetical protein
VVTSFANSAAVTCVALTYVVTRGIPLKFTIAPLTKPDPLTVSVRAPEPTDALEGCRDVSAGVGFITADPS